MKVTVFASFAWKVIVCITKLNLFNKGEKWNFLKWEKYKDKDLIWHVVDEMVKKWSRASFYLSCNCSCTLYLLLKVLLIKVKTLHTSAYFNLNKATTKQKPKMWRVQRWWDLSKLVTNTLTSLILVILSTLFCFLSLPSTFSWGQIAFQNNKNSQRKTTKNPLKPLTSPYCIERVYPWG